VNLGLVCGILCLALGACSSRGSQRKIAVIPKGTMHEFWKSIHAGAKKAADECGVEIIWKGPLKEDNREDQVKVVEDFISRGVNGIVLAPLDDVALVAPVEEAIKNKIPVVIMDSDLKSDKQVSFVATDNEKGGYLGGKRLAELLGEKGKVILLRYQEGSASTNKREEGFLRAMKEYPNIEVISSNQYAGATTETATQASENLLEKVRSGIWKVDGIFCPNESSAFGMLRALQNNKLAGKVKYVGFDASPKLVKALKDGEIEGLVLQNPAKMGYLAVQAMVEHLDGKPVEKRIDTGVVLATKENMEQPDIKALLEPPKE
jgi:ribose transport system substrate-binding protein